MALIECKSCGHLISDKAVRCPKCGTKKGEITQEKEKLNEGIPYEPHVFIIEKETEKIIEKKTEKKIKGIKKEDKEPEQDSPVSFENKRLSKKHKRYLVPILLTSIIISGLWYFLSANKEETVVITPDFSMAMSKYEEFYSFKEGLAAVKRNGRWGYINVQGKEIIPCQYLGSEPHGQGFSFSEGLAVVIDENQKYGYIDKKGKMVVEPVYNHATNFSCGVAAVLHPSRNKIDFINKQGNIVKELSGKYVRGGNYLPMFYNDTCEVDILKPKEKQREGDYTDVAWIDIHGNKVNRPHKTPNDSYAEPIQDEKGWIKYEDNGFYGYKDKDGNIMIHAKYKSIGKYTNGVALVKIGYGETMRYKHFEDEENFTISGFVDRFGNDTFTAADYKRISTAKEHKKERMRREKEEERRRLAAMKPNWLYGTWVVEVQGYKIEMIISKNNLIQRIGGQTVYNGAYYYDGNEELLYEQNASGGWEEVWPVDKNRKALMYNGSPLRKTNGSNEASSYESSNKERLIQHLEKKVQNDINELNAMVSSGHMHPANLMYLKQSLSKELTELMDYYHNQGNSTKYNDYAFKMRVVLGVFRDIGF